jgi:microcystin-dependent protein
MEAYVGEIRLFAGDYAPENWHICDGSTLSINSNEALYSLIGTTYGGDGATNFKLPDLRGRVAVGQGQGTGLTQRNIASSGGSETVALDATMMPAHNHTVYAETTTATTNQPSNALLASAPATDGYYVPLGSNDTVNSSTLNAGTVGMTGSGTAHNNMMPSMALTYIICLVGYYPERQ